MKRSIAIVVLVMAIFFAISFVTNILDPLMPTLRSTFGITGFQAALMAFAFFSAYGLMSIPAGLLIERLGARIVLVTGIAFSLTGACVFALWPVYAVALPSLFTIAIGFAMLQVVINPLLREAGGEANYAMWANVAQLVFGGASFVSPFVYAKIVSVHAETAGTPGQGGSWAWFMPEQAPWVGLYWIIAGLLAALLVVVSLIRIPASVLRDQDRIGSWQIIRGMLGNRVLLWYFLGIFCYVGLEQGVALSIAQYLQDYHGIDPAKGGHVAVAWFWGSMLIGCAVGLVLLRFCDARHVLFIFAFGALCTLFAALSLPSLGSQIAFSMMGFWCSVMWPVIFALALNSFRSQHGAIAGVLCTGIMGGAVVPLLIGHLSDLVGLRFALLALMPALGCIMAIAIRARPLVRSGVGGDVTDGEPAPIKAVG